MYTSKELSANDFRDRYFTKYETSIGPVFVLKPRELEKLDKRADHPNSEALVGKAGVVLATIDESKLVKRYASPEININACPGQKLLSFEVNSDYDTAYVGRRFLLYDNVEPLGVAPLVVGVPKERAAEFVPLLQHIFSKKKAELRELTWDEAELIDALKGSWFWLAGQGLTKRGLFTYDTNTAVPNADAAKLLREITTGITELQQKAAKLEELLRQHSQA